MGTPGHTQEMLDFCGKHNITSDVEVRFLLRGPRFFLGGLGDGGERSITLYEEDRRLGRLDVAEELGLARDGGMPGGTAACFYFLQSAGGLCHGARGPLPRARRLRRAALLTG